jgi:xanthine dehydrogenase molybdenum-binding subunit
MTDSTVIGKSPAVRESRDKVTGRAVFVDDMKADLSVKILGSPHPHALITKIDTSRALQLEGVRTVLTHQDVPDKLIFFATHRACLVMDAHVRHVGDYVAAVAATSEAIAEQALDLIEVEYEVLPAVFDPEEALQPDAPRIYPEGNDFALAELPFGAGSTGAILQEWGNIDEGFAQADVIAEGSYEVNPQVHSALEPHVCMARWEGTDLTIWNATQIPSELRLIVSDFFEIPESRVVVLSEHIGGGFGGKYTGRYQFVTCLLAKMLPGRSLKLALTREETQRYARRPRGKLRARVGAREDGTICALHFTGYFDIGAYGDFHGGANGFHHEGGTLSYKTPNARFEAFDVHTNHFRSECMRSVQAGFIAYAVESTVDRVAEQLGLDPGEMRARNVPDTGDEMPPGGYVVNNGMYPEGRLDIFPARDLLGRVLEKIDWKSKWKGWGEPMAVDGPKRRGIGLAYCMTYGGLWLDGASQAKVAISSDGSATIYSAAQELGQGINTTLCMLAAESLGVPLDDVAIFTGDTRNGVFDLCAARSSHQLATVGGMILKAVENAKQQLRELAAPRWEAHPDQVEIHGKKVFLRDHPERSIPLSDLFAVYDPELIGQMAGVAARFHPPVIGTATGPRSSIDPMVKPGFKAHQPMVMAAEVEVDVETGEVTPLRLVTGTFPGKMINPDVVRGQALGGAAQTLGWALWEELRYDEETSRYLSDGFTDYRLPRVLDMPEIENIFIEEVDEESPPHEGLPYGGRGVGEMTAWGPVVIASAIRNATGVRMLRSPMTAETVLEALEEEGI